MNESRIRRQQGYILKDQLLVFVFIVTVVIITFVVYFKLLEHQNAELESKHLSELSTGVRNLYAAEKSFAGVSNKTLLNANLIPDDMRIAGDVVGNVWDGTVAVAPAASVSKYTITYTNVPPSECARLSMGVAANFLKLVVGATTIFDRTAGTSANSGGKVNIDPATVAAACRTAQNGIDMIFTDN